MIMHPSLKNAIQDIQIIIDGTEAIIPSDFSGILPPDFNQPVTIGNNVTNCYFMFGNYSNFNQPVTIPNNVTNCYGMFSNCRNFNQPIIIGNNVTNCRSLFSGCNIFNQPVTIPNNVTDCAYMFNYCSNFSKDIYFKTISIIDQKIEVGRSRTGVTGLLYLCNMSLRKNIHFNSVLNSIFNITDFSSIVGSSVTWTPMTDDHGFYNTAFNVYCYNDYVP